MTAPTPRSAPPSGQPIAHFQNTAFKLARCATEAQIGQVFVEDCVAKFAAGRLDDADGVGTGDRQDVGLAWEARGHGAGPYEERGRDRRPLPCGWWGELLAEGAPGRSSSVWSRPRSRHGT